MSSNRFTKDHHADALLSTSERKAVVENGHCPECLCTRRSASHYNGIPDNRPPLWEPPALSPLDTTVFPFQFLTLCIFMSSSRLHKDRHAGALLSTNEKRQLWRMDTVQSAFCTRRSASHYNGIADNRPLLLEATRPLSLLTPTVFPF